MEYPECDFLRDFAAWRTSFQRIPSNERAKLIFSMRYGADADLFSYRFNRFICILDAIHKELPALIHDRIAFRNPSVKGAGLVPEELLLALHEWYCSLSDLRMRDMPDPEWGEVLAIFDRRW